MFNGQFASTVTADRCELFYVARVDKAGPQWTYTRLTYPPSDFQTAIKRASQYQQEFDPMRSRYSYTVFNCD